MARQILISFAALGEVVAATLLEEDAPATCDAIWAALKKPIERPVRHARGIGPEIYLMLPPMPSVPNEHMTVFPIPGDLLFYHYEGQLPRGECIYDIGMYYDRGGHSFWDVGWVPGNVFATVSQNLEGLQRVGRIISSAGAFTARVERLSEGRETGGWAAGSGTHR